MSFTGPRFRDEMKRLYDSKVSSHQRRIGELKVSLSQHDPSAHPDEHDEILGEINGLAFKVAYTAGDGRKIFMDQAESGDKVFCPFCATKHAEFHEIEYSYDSKSHECEVCKAHIGPLPEDMTNAEYAFYSRDDD